MMIGPAPVARELPEKPFARKKSIYETQRQSSAFLNDLNVSRIAMSLSYNNKTGVASAKDSKLPSER